MEQIVPVTHEGRRPNHRFLRNLERGLRVLEVMAGTEDSLHVSALARSLQIPKTTVFRILFTLQELGHVRQDPRTHAYQLTRGIGWLTRTEEIETLRRVARPHMARLLTRFEQTVNLAVLDRQQVLYVEILEGLRSIRMSATVNTYAPVHSTAVGKSILAYMHPIEAKEVLKRNKLVKLTAKTITSVDALLESFMPIRNRGYAVDNEETERGARCIASPILNSRGRPVAAISISGPVSHLTSTNIKQIARRLIGVGEKISNQLGLGSPLKLESNNLK
jgi:IclR family transcriptional regulator, KDG regulon repressor